MTGGITYDNVAAVNLTWVRQQRRDHRQHDHRQHGGLRRRRPDTINVQAISGPTSLWGGSGNLTTNIGSAQPVQGGIIDDITAPLNVNGAGGVNALNVDDSGSGVNKTGTLTSNTVTGLGMANGITYGGMAAVSITLGQGSVHL